jgi:hypothetical protein
MKHIVALLIVLSSIPAQAKRPPEPKHPYIVHSQPSFDRCTTDDPHGPCPGIFVVVKNPTQHKMWVGVGAVACSKKIRGRQACVIIDDSNTISPGKEVEFDLGAGVGPVHEGTLTLVWQKS